MMMFVLAAPWSQGHAMNNGDVQALSPKSYRAMMAQADDLFSSGEHNIYDELGDDDGDAKKPQVPSKSKKGSKQKSKSRKHASKQKQKKDQKESTDNNRGYAQGLIELHLNKKDCRKDPEKLVKGLQAIYQEAGGENRIFNDKDFVSDFYTWLAVLDVNNIRNKDDENPLHVAARKGEDWVCTILLGVGAKIDVVDAKGETPVHKAIMKKHKSACKVLLRAFQNLSDARSFLLKNGLEESLTAQQALDEIEAGE